MSKRNDFERGFFCAVATMIRMDGHVETQARELFGMGGEPANADPYDIQTFREHGLMPAAQNKEPTHG